MELQLGLALPCSDGYVRAQQQQQRRRRGLDLDLNVNGFGGGGGHGCDEEMVEAVGSNRFDPRSSLESADCGYYYNRSEEECEYEYEEQGNCERSVPRTLPLLFGGTRDDEVEGDGDDGERHHRFSGNKESTYLKVTMEGVGIGRKIDLSLHRSLHSLMYTLINMFGLCYEESENLKLAYQDRDGDWVLAENVTWRSFVRSAQRLKLMRMSG